MATKIINFLYMNNIYTFNFTIISMLLGKFI